MKIKPTRPAKLIDEGQINWESTDEYNKKVNEIRRELLDKYSLVLSTNWFKRLFIKTRLWLELKKELTS